MNPTILPLPAETASKKLKSTLKTLRPRPKAVGWWLCSLLMCPLTFGLGPVPAAVCLLCACTKDVLTPVTLGLLMGYGLRWGLAEAFPMYVLSAAVLCARLFGKNAGRRLPLAVVTAVSVLLGLILTIIAGFTLYSVLCWTVNSAAAAGAAALFQAVKRERRAKIAASALLMLSLHAIPLPSGLDPALCAISWVICTPGGLPYACASCAALAAFDPGTTLYAPVFCLSVLACAVFPEKSGIFRFLVRASVYCLAGLRTGNALFSLCAVLGSAGALVLSPVRFFSVPQHTALPAQFARHQLEDSAQALQNAAHILEASSASSRRELSELMDYAEAQVCRSCARSSKCRADHPREEEIAGFREEIFTQGHAGPEDLPPWLQKGCLHAEAYRTAVNDALENARAGRRMRARMDEARSVAAMQYALIGSFLRALSHRLYDPDVPRNYSPEIAVQAAGRGGSKLSGDRGAAFCGPRSTYYVLLCDGMGTGAEAAQESVLAIEMLRGFLLSGLDAESALNVLNGIYILRDNGCFSTVDLLRVNLTSGDAILYKWGSSASYLKRHRGVRLLGGNSLPPGITKNGEMERIHFSLDHGCVIVLLTDGLGGDESRGRLESCRSLRPEDVARSLFAGRETPEDDCTAVALRLRPDVKHRAGLTLNQS